MKKSGPSLNFKNQKFNFSKINNNNNSLSKVSFEGIFNENYFEISSKEFNLILNLEISKAKIKNPLTSKPEYHVGLILKSKYDGEEIKEPIDLSIILDISESMNKPIDNDDNNSRINLAKDALMKLILNLKNSDKLSLISFNDNPNIIFPLSNKNECINNLSLIKELKAEGGTNILLAVKKSIESLIESTKLNKRIILITDMLDNFCDNNNENEELKELFKKSVKELNIPITIISISGFSNTSLANNLCKEEGCNYFSVTKDEDLDYFLNKIFKYITFPIAYNLNIELENENLEIEECIGDGFDKDKFYINQNAPPINNNQNKNINSKTIIEQSSSFPSELNIKDLNLYQKGGLILIKFKYFNENKKIINIRLNYLSREKEKISQNYFVEIDGCTIEKDEFSNNNIETGIALYYFGDLINKVYQMKKDNLINKFNFKEVDKIKKFFISHYKTYDDEDKNKNQYLDLLNQINNLKE
jgi:hypothetical protein